MFSALIRVLVRWSVSWRRTRPLMPYEKSEDLLLRVLMDRSALISVTCHGKEKYLCWFSLFPLLGSCQALTRSVRSQRSKAKLTIGPDRRPRNVHLIGFLQTESCRPRRFSLCDLPGRSAPHCAKAHRDFSGRSHAARHAGSGLTRSSCFVFT